VRTYISGTGQAEHFIDMKIDRFGNVYETGWRNISTFNSDITTLKYNNAGVLQWSASYNTGPGFIDGPSSISVDSFGNCYIAGYFIDMFGPLHGIIIKYNLNGDTLWTRKLITIFYDEFIDIAIDPSNLIYVTGLSGDSAIVFKYDMEGNLIWRTSFYESQYKCLKGFIKLDKLNNLYIGSEKVNVQNSEKSDILIRKYTPNGTLLWTATYNNPLNRADWLSGLAIDNSSNCYIVGFSDLGSGRDYDLVTIKFDSTGKLQWSKLYNGQSSANDQGTAITCDSLGSNIFVTGFSFDSVSGFNYVTIKYNSYGDSLWVRTYNGTGNYSDRAYDIAIDKSYNVYVTGESRVNENDFDVATIKYSVNGNQEWIVRWTGTNSWSDAGKKITLDDLNNIYIGGVTTIQSVWAFLAIKYSQTQGIKQIGNNVLDRYILFQNYPNPFNPKTSIKFQVSRSSDIKIIVFDLLGREVATLVNEKLSPGTYETDWDASTFTSGVYFYRLIADGNIIDTKKLILIK